MFTHLSLKHFKSITSAEIDLQNLTVLVGPNSSGKSNVIDSIRFLHDAITADIDTAISSRQGFASIRERTPKSPFDVTIGFHFKNENVEGRYTVVLTSITGGAHAVKSEEGNWRGKILMPSRTGTRTFNFSHQDTEVAYKRKTDGSVVLTIGDNQEKKGISAKGIVDSSELLLRDLRSLKLISEEAPDDDAIIPITPFITDAIRSQMASYEHYSIFPNDLRQPQKPVSEKRLSSTGDNLTAVLKDMSSPSKRQAKNELIAALRRVEPDLMNINAKSIAGYLVPVFDFKDAKGRQYTFNVSQISDGTLRLLALLTALYQPAAPRCMSIEEPEQNINPGALCVLADAIKDVAKRRQIFLTTHSPELLDQFDAENIIAVERVGCRTRCGNLKPYQKKLIHDGLFRVGELMKTEGLRADASDKQ